MKKIILLFTVLIGLGLFSSCKKDEKSPVLNIDQTTLSAINSPVDGATYVLTRDTQGDTMTTFEWTPTYYALDDLPEVYYVLEACIADSGFINIKEITITTDTAFGIKVSGMNQKLIAMEDAVLQSSAPVHLREILSRKEKVGAY